MPVPTVLVLDDEQLTRSFVTERLRIFPVLLAGILLALASEAAWAQAPLTGTISGRVQDSSGGVVPRATVVVRSRSNTLERVVDTSSEGVFEITALPAGSFDLSVLALGFAAHHAVIEVPAVGVHSVELTPAPVVEEVRVVSGSRQEELRASLNTRVDVITRARLDETGAESVGEVLRDLPGLLTRRESESTAAAGEQIQGIDSRQVLVLVDGQPIAGARGIKRGSALNLDRQSTGRLERIEVVKGASSALYGSDAIGGVINLITRDAGAPLEVAASLAGAGDGDMHARGEIGARRGRWSGLFTTERHQHDGFDLTPTTFDTTAAAFRRVDGMGKVRAQLRPSLGMSGLVSGYTNRARGYCARGWCCCEHEGALATASVERQRPSHDHDWCAH